MRAGTTRGAPDSASSVSIAGTFIAHDGPDSDRCASPLLTKKRLRRVLRHAGKNGSVSGYNARTWGFLCVGPAPQVARQPTSKSFCPATRSAREHHRGQGPPTGPAARRHATQPPRRRRRRYKPAAAGGREQLARERRTTGAGGFIANGVAIQPQFRDHSAEARQCGLWGRSSGGRCAGSLYLKLALPPLGSAEASFLHSSLTASVRSVAAATPTAKRRAKDGHQDDVSALLIGPMRPPLPHAVLAVAAPSPASLHALPLLQEADVEESAIWEEVDAASLERLLAVYSSGMTVPLVRCVSGSAQHMSVYQGTDIRPTRFAPRSHTSRHRPSPL